jgi:gluconolactonase
MNLRALLLLLATPSLLTAADQVFAEGADWEVVSQGHQFAEGMTWDKDGHFYFTDVFRSQLFRVDRDSGEKTLIDGATGQANGIAFGPDGRLYGGAGGDQCIYAWEPKTWQKVRVSEGTVPNDIVILQDGTIYYTELRAKFVWRLAAGTFKRDVGVELNWRPNGIALSRDQKTLLVAEFDGDTVHGFALGADSRISGADRPAYKLAVPSDGMGRLDGMLVLADGRLLIGTMLGSQIAPPVFGAAEAARLIITPSPNGRPRCNYVRISPDGAWLYAAYATDLLRRRLRPDFGQP